MTEFTEEELSGSVLPEEIDDIAVPAPLNKVLPWHSPRKQYIREMQWGKLTGQFLDKFLENISLSNGSVNYLTLPGVDYFDVEVISMLLKSKGVGLEVTGFLNEKEGNAVLARSQFRAESLIENNVMTDTSITFHKRFEEISVHSSQVFQEIKKRAPFHIVNIDACGSIARPSARESTRIIDALHSLVELQLNRMRDPWILFLTVDACSDSLSESVREKLEEAIVQNALKSVEFHAGADTLFDGKGGEIRDTLNGIGNHQDMFISMFSLGLSKWMLHNVENVQWGLNCKKFYSYSTNPTGSPSMSCLAFEFKPNPLSLNDQRGIVELAGKSKSSLPDYSMMALKRAREMVNLDEMFTNDSELFEKYALKQRKALEIAGYQATALSDFDNRYLATGIIASEID